VSSLPEAGGPYSLQVDPNSVDAISEALRKVIEDEELRTYMLKGGREYAMQTFEPSSLAKQLMDIYKNEIQTNS
jgi:glycosyltransferase involved in cell wall biosynthesis